MPSDQIGCGTSMHVNRRTLLKMAGVSGLSWLTPLAEALAKTSPAKGAANPKSVILLWLSGGPSQLETFDPHAGTTIAAGTKAIDTSIRGVQLAEGMEQTAEILNEICVLRNVVSKEGDHERAIYNVKTGFRPDPSLQHPSIGAMICHQLSGDGIEIPRHISILPGNSPGRGGYLGNSYDAFQADDPIKPLADLRIRVKDERLDERLKSLSVVDRQFSQDRIPDLEKQRTSHRDTIERAVRMMNSDQLKAFDIKSLPKSELDPFGDSAFGRGCLAAARLIEVGVRCVEVTLSGWDTHVNNHDFHTSKKKVLDPAFAGLIRYLKERELWDDTIVICGGEFGRSPTVNPGGGRDHWPHGFSVAMAGGGLPKGCVIGETDPKGEKLPYEKGIPVADIHASVLHRLGVNFASELDTPIGRPMKISEGRLIPQLVG